MRSSGFDATSRRRDRWRTVFNLSILSLSYLFKVKTILGIREDQFEPRLLPFAILDSSKFRLYRLSLFYPIFIFFFLFQLYIFPRTIFHSTVTLNTLILIDYKFFFTSKNRFSFRLLLAVPRYLRRDSPTITGNPPHHSLFPLNHHDHILCYILFLYIYTHLHTSS